MPTSTALSVNNQRGFSPLLIIILLAVLALGIIAYFFFSQSNPLTSLFPKKETVAASAIGIQPGQPIDDNGNILITEDVANRLRDSGAKWVRLNFRLGPYSSDTPEFYSKYDTFVKRLNDRGIQVVALMSNESWHSGNGQQGWVENNFEHTGRDGHNKYIDEFGYAFARMAKHFEGKIKYWEIWNEPNCWSQNPSNGVYTGCSYIYPSNFAAMLTHVHTQAHYYNNIDVEIISGGLFGHDISGFGTGPAGADYLDDTYNAGINKTGKWAWTKATYGKYPLDGVGQHIYITGNKAVDKTAFSNYLDYINNVVKKYEGFGSNKKTWVTEYGWATNQLSESLQASNLSAVIPIFNAKPYVASSFWFQLDESPGAGLFYGLYRTDGSGKPALSVFRNLNPTSSVVAGQKEDGSFVSAIKDYYDTHGGQISWGSPFDNGGGVYAHMWDYGYVQDFNGGTIGKGTIFDTGHSLAYGFWNKYMEGDNHFKLKFPISEEYPYASGTRQDFQGGYMTWDPVNQVRVFTGTQTPSPTPTPTPTATPSPTPTVTSTTSVKPGQREDGKFVDSIRKFYNNNGGEAKWGNPFDNGGGAYAHKWDFGFVQDFDGGSIGKAAIFDTGHSVAQGFREVYLQGDNHMKLRFPKTEEYAYKNGTRQDFQKGYMTWDPLNNIRVFVGGKQIWPN